MTLVNIQPWVLRAQSEHYAIGAFNANTLEQAQAIVAAAEQEHAPVIIQVSHRALQHVGGGDSTLGMRYMACIGSIAAGSVSVPVGLHLDHAPEVEALQAMALGFTSVMFSGDDLPLTESIRVTQTLREQAHSLGASLEGELGQVPRANYIGKFPASVVTNPDQAAEFVRATKVDSLAISIGSVHGVNEKIIRLNLKHLETIRANVSVPLVLHGSSGVVDIDISAGIALGLCKVNVATQLNQVFTGAVRKVLADAPNEIDPRKYLQHAREAVIEYLRERICFFGSSAKAA